MTAASTAMKQRRDDSAQVTAAGPLSADELRQVHAYWRAANYLSVGQIYLMDNPLLKGDLDRFHLVMDVIDRLPQLGARAAYLKQALHEKLIEHKQYVRKHGDDMPEIAGWRWGVASRAALAPGVALRATSTEGDNV